MLASKPKRLLSLLLVLVMLLGLVPTSVFAAGPTDAETTQREKQIVDWGGVTYYTADGTEGSEGDYAVKLTKTVEPTGTENRFTINLKVETRQNIEELEAAPDAAVVLVFDVSDSMTGGNDVVAAREAANKFLTRYVEGAGNAQRKVAVVEFGTGAQTVLNWTEANEGGQVDTGVRAALDMVENQYIYYDCYQEGPHQCTNTCGYVIYSSTVAWDLKPGHMAPVVGDKCKFCNYVVDDIRKVNHFHCTECGAYLVAQGAGLLEQREFAAQHQHPKSYDGPHSILLDGNGKIAHSSMTANGSLTNIRAGMMLARNLVLAGQKDGGAINGINNVYVILLSDGVPTITSPNDLGDTDELKHIAETASEDGNPENSTWTGEIPSLAQDIQGKGTYKANPGAKLFVVGYKDGMNRPVKEGAGTGGEVEICETAAKWFQEIVQVDQYYAAENSNDLVLKFEGIAQFIKTMANAWIVTDPIPKDGYVTYAENNTFEASKHAQWDPQNNQVVWDLKQMTPEPGDDEGTFVYKLSYNVILHPEVPGFQAKQAYPTNGQAQLSYLMLEEGKNLDDMTPEEITDLLQTVNFETPEVQGYLGQFNFMKYAQHQDATGNDIPLSGATFKLSNDAATNLDAGAGKIERMATSKSGAKNEPTKGQVEFASIPSGYTYTLSENGEFTSDGKIYAPTTQTWDNVTVSYGVVTGGPGADGVRNTIKQQPRELTLTKTWNAPKTAEIMVDVYRKDAGAQGDGERIATLTLNGRTCRSDSEAVQVTCATNEAKQWVYTLTVDRYNQATGGEYTYTVKEQALSGYTTTYGEDTLSITNTATGTTSVYVEKKWLPIDDQPMENPPAVQVQLSRSSDNVSDQPVETVTLDAEGNWKYRWDDLDQYDTKGALYTYSVAELPGTGYQQVGNVTGTGTEGNPFVITNTVDDAKTPVTITKTWNDTGAAARPASITVELLRDGKPFSLTSGTTTTVELTSANESPKGSNTWTYTFEDLPKYEFTRDGDGKITAVHEYEYSVAELGTVEGYRSAVDSSDPLHIINTQTETVTITVNKVWDDKGYNGLEHQDVTVELKRGSEVINSAVLSDEARSVTFDTDKDRKPLQKFDSNGQPYVYTVVEQDAGDLYTDSVSYGEDNTSVTFDPDTNRGTVTVTNTLAVKDDTVDVTVNKTWLHPAGTTAPEVTFTLAQYKEGNILKEETFRQATLTSGKTSLTFEDLPRYYYENVETDTGEQDGEGNPIYTTEVVEKEYSYTVTEKVPDNYEQVGEPQHRDNTWNFTNRITGQVTLTATKKWVDLGERPVNATITLMRTDGAGPANFEAVPDAEAFVTDTDGSKKWIVDKYDEDGQLYIYKVVENAVSGYQAPQYSAPQYSEDVTEITVTNTLAQATYDVPVTKIWNDNSNAQNTRKDITLTLYRTGYNAEELLGTVVISADGNKTGGTYGGSVSVDSTKNPDRWTITFTGLEKYAYQGDQMKLYTYLVAEEPVEGYDSSVDGLKVTNTLETGATSVTLSKHWVDPADKVHPNVTFTLTAKNAGDDTVITVGGQPLPTGVTLGFESDAAVPYSNEECTEPATNTGDWWYYTFENLPKYDDNQSLITYTVSEGTVAGYTCEQDVGNTFTNTIKQETLNFTGTKTWNMSELESDDYLKPEAQPVWIALYYVNDSGELGQMVTKDGAACLTRVQPEKSEGTITASFAFNDLPRYNLSSGAEYRYTVREVEETVGQDGQRGYSAIENGGTITFQVIDAGQTYNYNYTVKYEEQDTESNGNYTGSTTQVTNTYGDPQYYFYKILAKYTTKFSDNGRTIYTATGVNVTPDDKGYIALTPEEWAALTGGTVTVNPNDYASHQVNGEDVTFDFVPDGSKVSVTLDEVNHMYVITLNYERELHKLTVNYSFEGMQTPPSGFESVTTPNLGTADGDGNYSDPGCYTSGQSYTTDPKTGSIPNGYQLTKVLVNGEEKSASFTGGSFGTGDNFKDITVEYVYTRIPGTHPDITDRITVNKYDDGEPQKLITSSSATFGLYSDENCENQVGSYATSGGTVNIEASASGLGAGTYYLKEISAPTGYTLSDQVWKLTVTVTPKEEWDNNTWVKYDVYDITATLADEPVTSIDVTDKLLRDDYVVEYYFEQTPDGDDYEKGKDRDGNEYPDVPGKIGYFDTVKAEDHYLPDEDVPDGYHHGHDDPASIEYDDVNKTIKIYYDLDVPASTVEGNKVWHGEQTTAYVAVYQKLDGTLGAQPYQTPVQVGETSNHFSFSNLPQYVGGKAATYEVYEVISDGHSGWTKVESGSKIELNGKDYQVSYDGANIVNTELMDIPVTKTWIDGNSADRPGSVTIALYQNDQKVGSGVSLTAAANWKYTFQDLPKYDENGDLYTYKVYEMNGSWKVENNGTIGGYTVIYDGAYQNEITNKLTDIDSGETSATVTKTWIAPWAELPEEITFQLYRTTGTTLESTAPEAEPVQDVVLTKPAGENLVWTATVDELKTRNDQGYPYTYFFEEQAVAGFTGRHNAAKTEFTNVIDQVNDVTVSGSKRWVDNGVARPTSVTIVLQSDEAQQGVFADVAGKTVEINEAGNWQFTFDNLPRYVYTEDQGVVTGVREIVYKVTDSVPNYTTTGGTAADGYVLTNTFQQEYLDIPVTKAWIDGNNTDGNRPEEVAIALFRNGVKFQDAAIAAAGDWKYTFEDLPKYSDNQKTEYEYKVYEMDGGNQVENNGTAGGYTVTYAGDNQRDITNKLTDITTGKTSATVTKTWIAPWVDLPSEITFKLYRTTGTTLEAASAQFVRDVVLTKPADESLEWTATVSDLPTRNAQGYRYTYFFEEQAVSGFELTDTNPAKTQFTNRIQQVSDVKVSVEKLWDGAIANSIPDSLFVQLYRDGVSMGDTYNVELKPDADGKWTYTFENLDRYDLTTGKYYSYTVQEGYFTDNEGVKTWNPVAESETITFNKDTGDYTFQVSYNTTGYETNEVQATITNTYDSCKLYQYRVDRVYNYYSDGDLVPGASSMVTGDVTDGTKDQIITVTDEEADAFKKTDGKEEFTYVTGDPAVDDGTGKLVPTVTLTKVGELCVITLLYEFRYNTPSPDYHKVTVNYYDEDGNKIDESFVSDRIREGRSWDFSDKVRDTITVDGVTYVLDHADGDPITGTNIRRDQVVDLHYVVQEPDVDIPDEDPPQGGEPDDPGVPDEPDVEIPDPVVPEGNLPQTGTTADQLSVSAGGLLSISAILAATGLVVVELSRRKEQEEN